MKFQKGNRAASGGKRNPAGGRPTKEKREVERLVAEMTKKYLENHLKPVLDTYISLASGEKVGKKHYKLDPATCRHFIERFLGPAPRTLHVDLQDSIESFFEKVMSEGGKGNEGTD